MTMLIDPELLLLAAIVLPLAGLIWLVPMSRAVYHVARTSGDTRMVGPARAAIKRRPVTLLTVEAKPGRAFIPLAREGTVSEITNGDTASSHEQPRDPVPAVGTHMARIGEIVAASVDTALRAQKLHRMAHEQVDSAHYALQNLLNELSAIMPIAAPASATKQSPASRSRVTLRPVYETALAA
jgi:hypothetical protein